MSNMTKSSWLSRTQFAQTPSAWPRPWWLLGNATLHATGGVLQSVPSPLTGFRACQAIDPWSQEAIANKTKRSPVLDVYKSTVHHPETWQPPASELASGFYGPVARDSVTLMA